MSLKDIVSGILEIIRGCTSENLHTCKFGNTCIMIPGSNYDIINYWKEKLCPSTFELDEEHEEHEELDENTMDDNTFFNTHKMHIVALNSERSIIYSAPNESTEHMQFVYKLNAIKELCSLLNISKTYNENLSACTFSTQCMKVFS
jgi:hypothetical protein